MFEEKTSQAILSDMLARVDSSLDTREGSIIYDALAPVASELSKIYAGLDDILHETFVDTASLENLKKRAAERGIIYIEARQSIIAAQIELADGDELQIGSRFFIDSIGFVFEGAVSDDGMEYLLACETTGSLGNIESGTLVFDGQGITVKSAKILKIVTAGRDAESEDELRARYYEYIDSAPFGGNKAAYREFVLGLPKVGGCRVDRVGEIDVGTAEQYPDANVFVTVIGENYDMPDADDLIAIETAINGDNASGDAGLGFAPIDHRVMVLSVLREQVYFAVTAELKDGYTADAVLPRLTEKAREIVRAVGEDWAKHGGGTLKKSAVFAAMLTVEGVADISGLTMKAFVTDSDGNNELLTCNARSYTGRYIPYLSDVSLASGGGAV